MILFTKNIIADIETLHVLRANEDIIARGDKQLCDLSPRVVQSLKKYKSQIYSFMWNPHCGYGRMTRGNRGEYTMRLVICITVCFVNLI